MRKQSADTSQRDSRERDLKAREQTFQDQKYGGTRSLNPVDNVIDPTEFAQNYLSPEFKTNAKDRGCLRLAAFEALLGTSFGGSLKQARQALSGKSILDYTCGDGYFAVFLAMMGAKVIGFDISSKAIEVAKIKALANKVEHRAKFTVADASRLPFAADRFDLVIGIESLHHVIFYSNVAEDLHRVIKLGGHAVFAEPLGHNAMLEAWRSHFSLKAVETTLKYPDVRALGACFTRVEFQELSLFFMFKRVFRYRLDLSIVKAILKSVWRLDNAIMRLVPATRRFCGEVVITLYK